MKERPILFSAPMVRAILADRKTQTRRIAKPAPSHVDEHGRWYRMPSGGESLMTAFGCPYGAPGDRLWVRETWGLGTGGVLRTVYRADGDKPAPGFRWHPSIHMRRSASRITLEIMAVRIERLHQITETDAICEGMHYAADGYWSGAPHDVKGTMKAYNTARDAFMDLWRWINGPKAWSANSYVWVVDFRRVTP